MARLPSPTRPLRTALICAVAVVAFVVGSLRGQPVSVLHVGIAEVAAPTQDRDAPVALEQDGEQCRVPVARAAPRVLPSRGGRLGAALAAALPSFAPHVLEEHAAASEQRASLSDPRPRSRSELMVFLI